MIFGTHDTNTLEQFGTVLKTAVHGSLMADGHYGHIMPVGGVAAYDNKVSVNGVGFDIGCGNCAIKTNLTLMDITSDEIDLNKSNSDPSSIINNAHLNKIADEINNTISFGIGRSNLANDAPVDHNLFYDYAWNIIPNTGKYRDDLKEKARHQLGTVGSGNHYVDVFVGEDEYIWVGVHFGSRGLGHTIASHFLAIGQGGTWGDKFKETEVLLNLSSDIGTDYWELMELAGRYAYLGREWVTRKIISILGGTETKLVHNHHNFAWREIHDIPAIGLRDLVVVRKGATPAFENQYGFVGGSMGDNAVVLRGTSNGDIATKAIQKSALFSTVHGAGRVMSRTEAKGKRDRKTGQLKRNKITGEIINSGKITPTMMNDWLNAKGVVLRGGDLDESPHAYRRLPDVLAAQENTVQVVHTLRPLIVIMAGNDIIDVYKD